MKSVINSERGVSLISLAVAIIIIGIITSMLLYNVKDTKDIERVSNMYTDVENISNRVSNYYSVYGALPVTIDVTSDSTVSGWISELESGNNEGPLGVNDTGKFYVIDLSALENLSLNYGSGFKDIMGSTLPQDKDVYVINENSHNVFYLHGVKINNNGSSKTYYTNLDKDIEVVNIKYVAGIKIPEGFTFKSGTTKNDLKIEDSSKVEYTWANTADGLYTMTKTEENDTVEYYLNNGESLNSKIVLTAGQDIEDLITSAKEFGGFYYTDGSADNTINVNYLSIAEDDNWGKAYDITATYTDKNGDTAYIPKGFKISKLSGLNTINKGLVIKNDTTQDEYVWIDVPDNVLENARTLEEIENALKDYTKDYREEGYDDIYEDGFINLTNGDATANSKLIYNNLKNNMLQSIKENGGFYIGRYEASKSSDNKVQSKKDEIPWYNITVANAQIAANAVSTNDYTTSLMFGIQWDLVCKFIEETGTKSDAEIKDNSREWGNYPATTFKVTSNNVMGKPRTGGWTNVAKGSEKNSDNYILFTTGASDRNMALNIYDLAGNVSELTLECFMDENKRSERGGFAFYNANGINYGANVAFHSKQTLDYVNMSTGFRVTLFQTPTT